MKQKLKKKWNKVVPIFLFTPSRQILAHPIRNFLSNQSSIGGFDNIVLFFKKTGARLYILIKH